MQRGAANAGAGGHIVQARTWLFREQLERGFDDRVTGLRPD